MIPISVSQLEALTVIQEIAPNYYDLSSWDGQKDVQLALRAVQDKMRRRAAMKAAH
jgi:hypothetical protein